MRRIHYFNPDNDLALANGSLNFTPPKAAIDLGDSGAALPLWYGKAGDMFLGAVNKNWFEEIRNTFGIEVYPAMHFVSGYEASPWGWSARALRSLVNYGCPETSLPSANVIQEWRTLSSRCTTVNILNNILQACPELSLDNPKCRPHIARDLSEALDRINDVGVAMIKLPWSGAGRGQQVSNRTTSDELITRIKGMIMHQGAVEISPFYDVKLDFAMLWEEGRFVGYSLFETDTHGGWTHNILLDDTKIETVILDKLGRYIDLGKTRNIIQQQLKGLSETYSYSGSFGVDFIIGSLTSDLVEKGSSDIDRQDKNLMIPVEINVRRTMGHVAHSLQQNFMAQNTVGLFEIKPSRLIKDPFFGITHGNPKLRVKEARLIEGCLDLVPPGGAFRFILRAQKDNIQRAR